jgi:hypothetical protein
MIGATLFATELFDRGQMRLKLAALVTNRSKCYEATKTARGNSSETESRPSAEM